MNSRTLLFVTFFISLTLLAGWFDRVERRYFGVQEGVVLEDIAVQRLLEGEVRDIVEELAIRYQKAPVEPTINKRNGRIVKEEIGYLVEVDTTVRRVLTAQAGEQVHIEMHSVPTQHTGAELEKVTRVLGSYSTSIHGSSARIRNIRMASASIHNTLVWPGDVFSFNEVTGPRTAERGYYPAPIIINGGFDLGLGGGVCQASSTLYNAALKSSLAIVERHPHSKPIHYVPAGRDATVDFGSLDLKFKNNRKQPIIVRMGVGGGRVMAEIRGGEQ